jgi:HEAT repeat protein
MRDSSWEECMALLERLPFLPLDQRRAAIETLARNPSPGIRQRALRLGAALLPDDQLMAYLRNEADDVLRNMGLEVLKLRTHKALNLSLDLLNDPDPDVVLQAVLSLDHVRDPRALDHLRGLLMHPNPNVVQATILAIGHIGDGRCVQDLLPFLKADPWLQVAAIQALGDFRAPEALKPLITLLDDAMVAPLAADSIARIGGRKAFRILADLRKEGGDHLESESLLGLLSHVIEGISGPLKVPEGLRASLARDLRNEAEPVRGAAAACLLALGPGTGDGAALKILASTGDARFLPSCLARRKDLTPRLLSRPEPLESWGRELARRYPGSVPPRLAVRLIKCAASVEDVALLAEVFLKIRTPGMGAPLLQSYLSGTPEWRQILLKALRAHRREVITALERAGSIPPEDSLVLRALLGAPAGGLRAMLSALPPEPRLRAAALLAARPSLAARLEWERWIREDGPAFVPLLADLASRTRHPKLVTLSLRLLEERADPALARLAGDLRDSHAVPVLLKHFSSAGGEVRAFVLEALGRIGGPQAREALAETARGTRNDEARLAFRALALCAVPQDVPFFLERVAHPAWMVRLACAEVLGRFPGPLTRTALTDLSADPMTLVSQRALALLDG